jgi:hypothetical protein
MLNPTDLVEGMLNTSFDCIPFPVLIDCSGSNGASLKKKNKFLPTKENEASLNGKLAFFTFKV